MTNIDASRSNFFPNTKTKAKANSNPLAKTQLARNNSERVSELNAYAKRDAKVDIGDAIKDFSRIKKAVDAAPEKDNSEKIAALKAQINSGQYKVDYDALADRIMKEEF